MKTCKTSADVRDYAARYIAGELRKGSPVAATLASYDYKRALAEQYAHVGFRQAGVAEEQASKLIGQQTEELNTANAMGNLSPLEKRVVGINRPTHSNRGIA